MTVKLIEQDMAGKWRAWVDVGGDSLLMLKFQSLPSEEEIRAAAQQVLDLRAQEEQDAPADPG